MREEERCTLRGGLGAFWKALIELEEEPSLLERSRSRFSRSPPYYASPASRPGTRTRSRSPDESPNQQKERERENQLIKRRLKLQDEYAASRPFQQFRDQTKEEKERIWKMNPHSKCFNHIPLGSSEEKEAIETVKREWAEQGFWKVEWNEMAKRGPDRWEQWKHEDSLDTESGSDTNVEAESLPPVLSALESPQSPPRVNPRRPKSENENRASADRHTIREREREASRPYHQFVFQISKESLRLQGDSADKESVDSTTVNSRAYEIVKNKWARRGLWNKKWSILPGMSWKHEKPFNEADAEAMTTSPLAGMNEAGKTGPGAGHEISDLDPGRNDEWMNLPMFVSTNTPEQEQSPNTDISGRENELQEDGNHNREQQGTENLQRSIFEESFDGLSAGPASSPKSGGFFLQDEPAQQQPSMFGPFHPPKVPDVTGKPSERPQQQLETPQGINLPTSPLLFVQGNTASPIQPASNPQLRRSRRLMPPEPIIAQDSSNITPAGSMGVVAVSRPKRKVAGNPISTISLDSQTRPKRKRLNATRKGREVKGE